MSRANGAGGFPTQILVVPATAAVAVLALLALLVVAPVLVLALATVALVLCAVTIVARVARVARVGRVARLLRGRGSGDVAMDAVVRRVVYRVARRPSDARARRELAGHLAELERVLTMTDRLRPSGRATVRRVLGELGATTRLQARARSGRVRQRVTAIRQLAWLAPPDVVWRLDELTRDRDPDVALAAATALGGIPESAAYRALVRLLADDTVPPARTASILLGSAWDDPMRVLIQELPAGPPAVRYWGTILVGHSRDPRGIGLLEALLRDPDPDVRRSAASALALYRELTDPEPRAGRPSSSSAHHRRRCFAPGRTFVPR